MKLELPLFALKLFSSSLVLLVVTESLCDLQSFELSGPLHLHNESFDLQSPRPSPAPKLQDSTSYSHLTAYHFVAQPNPTSPFQKILQYVGHASLE